VVLYLNPHASITWNASGRSGVVAHKNSTDPCEHDIAGTFILHISRVDMVLYFDALPDIIDPPVFVFL
jgi:hypothetical protein